MTKFDKAKNLSWLEKFYAVCGYGGDIQPEDTVLYKIKNNSVVGVVRITKEHGVSILRGMQVLKQYQKSGIGRDLLSAFEQKIGPDTCYCLPYEHLEGFYSKIGFVIAQEKELPKFLVERKKYYLSKNMNVIAMTR